MTFLFIIFRTFCRLHFNNTLEQKLTFLDLQQTPQKYNFLLLLLSQMLANTTTTADYTFVESHCIENVSQASGEQLCHLPNMWRVQKKAHSSELNPNLCCWRLETKGSMFLVVGHLYGFLSGYTTEGHSKLLKKIAINDIMENLFNQIFTAEVFKSPLLPVCNRSHEVLSPRLINSQARDFPNYLPFISREGI